MWRSYLLCLFAALICAFTVACGTNNKETESQSANSDIVPCSLLTPEQVETVLPAHDGGFEAKAGGSLIAGVDAYQCSYSNADGDLFTVILNVAVDDARFKKIEPSASTLRMIHKDIREVQVGDRGWLFGEADDMKLRAVKALTVIDLELLASHAGDRSDDLVALASTIAQKLE